MRLSKAFSVLFALLGIALALAVPAACVLARNTAPIMLGQSPDAAQCAEELMNALCSGDYAGASKLLSGHPTLDGGQGPDSEVGGMIWQAFTQSLSYELTGNPYASADGAAQDVLLRSICIPDVVTRLRERVGELTAQKTADAEDSSEIFTENLRYREEFTSAVLREAAQDAIAECGTVTEQMLTLTLVCEEGRWLVLPDRALLSAISGGILES